MPSKHAFSTSVTEHLASFIRAEVVSGRYRSASAVVRAGLRLLEQQATRAPSAGGGSAAPREKA